MALQRYRDAFANTYSSVHIFTDSEYAMYSILGLYAPKTNKGITITVSNLYLSLRSEDHKRAALHGVPAHVGIHVRKRARRRYG